MEIEGAGECWVVGWYGKVGEDETRSVRKDDDVGDSRRREVLSLLWWVPALASLASFIECSHEIAELTFEGDEADLAVGDVVAGQEVAKEGEVEVHADADPVDEEDWEVRSGGVWDVPVGEVMDWAAVGVEEGRGSEGYGGEGGRHGC